MHYIVNTWDPNPNVLVIRRGSVLTKRPDDGAVEPKHVALNVFVTIN